MFPLAAVVAGSRDGEEAGDGTCCSWVNSSGLRGAKGAQIVLPSVKFVLKFGLEFAFGEQLKTQSLKLAFSKYSCL